MREQTETIDDISQIPDFVRRYLPKVEADPKLLALSFVDPLKLATDHLGIAVSSQVARAVRRGLRAMVTFDLAALGPDGQLRGVSNVRWRPKTHGN